MKTKLTFKLGLFVLLFSLTSKAQTFVYNESISSGMFFQGTNGGEVSNPVSDAVNSSANCAKSATDGNWQQIQYFPTFTPTAGDKLFFSVYNPNNVGPGQIQFEYTSGGGWQFGSNPSYEAGSSTGWVEYSIDLSNHVGNQINKIIMMPAGDNSAAVYVDNVYFGQTSVLNPVSQQTFVYNESISSGMFFQGTNGGEVSNPVSDAVNSSANCAKSATDGNWQQIQYFPTFTPTAGDKLFFSVYNPNNVGPGQIQFEYTSGGGWQFGSNPSYEAGSSTGWVEYSIDLSNHVGNQINKIIMMPAGDNSAAVYVDNIYFGQTSALNPVSQQTFVYNESISSGMFFQGTNGGEVSNPVSDAVNSSANCAKSATDGNWQQIQYFPTFTPSAGDKLFFSVYNPNNVGPGQIQFEYTSGGGWQFGSNPSYEAGSSTGWVEYSFDLSNHVGNQINKIIMMPAGDNSAAVYVDNIYFSNASVLSTVSPLVVEESIYIDSNGKISFDNDQINSEISVFDLTGRLIFKEKIEGNQSKNNLQTKGVYIVIHTKNNKFNSRKLVF